MLPRYPKSNVLSCTKEEGNFLAGPDCAPLNDLKGFDMIAFATKFERAMEVEG